MKHVLCLAAVVYMSIPFRPAFAEVAPAAGPTTNTPDLPLPDAQTPGVEAVLASHHSAIGKIEAERKSAATDALNRQLAVMTAMLAERKKARNTSGIAVATTGIDIFQTGITNIQAGGTFEPPARVRRELESAVSEGRTAVAAIEAKATSAKAQAFADALKAFTAIAARVAPDVTDEATLAARLLELINAFMAKGPARLATPGHGTPDKTVPASPSATATTNQAEVAMEPVLASSGEAEQWTHIASWRAAMMGMDIVSIPLAEAQQGTNATSQFNPMSGQNSEIVFIVNQCVTPADGMLYRLKRVPAYDGVDLLEWPSRANNHRLVIRVPARERYPSQHGFDLEATMPGATLAPSGAVLVARSVAKPPTPALVTIATLPEGAAVHINGVMQNVRTPCRVSLPLDTRSIVLSLPGYLPVVMTNQTFSNGQNIRRAFLPDPRIRKVSLAVPANAKAWTDTDMTVCPGDHLVIQAEGSWSCGPGKEMCDAQGYPNNQAFYRYYMNSDAHPRHTSSANYGALLLRIGENGRPMTAGTSTRLAATESGTLSFDINEGAAGALRADNTGAVIVNITLIPAPAPVPAVK